MWYEKRDANFYLESFYNRHARAVYDSNTSGLHEKKFFSFCVLVAYVDVVVVGLLRTKISDGEKMGVLVVGGRCGVNGDFRGCYSTR